MMKKMSRRDLLKGLGAMGMLAMAGPFSGLAACTTVSNPGTDSGARGVASLPDCILTPEVTEGPFYISASQMRQDITEGRAGTPLQLKIKVVNADTCEPIPSALVDVWHTDAEGVYSAFPGQGDRRSLNTTGETFLRGIQATDANGEASFSTIYPGWYPGRTTHIHFKVHFNDNTQVTSQFAFPEDISTEVYGQGVYQARGDKDTSNIRDGFFPSASSKSLLLNVKKEGDLYIASHNLGIALA